MTAAAAEKSPLDKLQKETDANLYEWLSEFGANSEIKVRLRRQSPRTHKGVPCSGALTTYTEPISEEEIENQHGGGTFKMEVQHKVKNRNGAPVWRYAGIRTFEIAGYPKVESLRRETTGEDDDDQRTVEEGPVSQAMSLAHQLAKDARDEARDLRQNSKSGTDWEALDRVVAPMRDQNSHLQQQVAELQLRLTEKLGEKPDTTHVDKVLGMWGQSNNDHSTRVQEIRINHDAEMRQLREHHNEELRRREDRLERELQTQYKAHEREIDSVKESQRSALKALEHGYEMRIKGLEEITHRLERELTEARTELAATRAKKEQGPLEQIQNLVQLKSGFEALSPTSSNDEDDKPTWLKVLETLNLGTAVEAVSERIAHVPGQQPAQGGPQDPNRLIPITRPDGQVMHVPAHVVAQQRRAQAAAEAAQAAGNGKTDHALDPAEVKRAVAFLESALRNGTPPDVFAASARNMVPEAILATLKQEGVDHFLADIAKLETGSPLATVVGRSWCRQVAQFLLEGRFDEADAAPPPPPDVVESMPDA